ncbi:MAG TPA: putative lipid II flippase FtsW [Candidatus Saccharimonadales bacterium]|nr:putative lipid II flippase FtsW [Candidatus Saccharimonadales bacterium]
MTKEQPRRAHQPDYILALVIFILLAIGLVMMYSISPVLSFKVSGSAGKNYYFYNHLFGIVVGVAGWIAATTIDYRYWKRWAPGLLVLAAAALLALMVPGLASTKNGATRWLALGPFTFQPSELLKLALIVYLAAWFERRGDQIRSFTDGLIPFAVIMFISGLAVVIFQRNLSTMMVLALAAMTMYFVAGISWRHLAALLAGAGVLVWATIVMAPHRLARLSTFLNPTKNTATGYHISQALIAVGSGGIFGLGLGKSIQVHGYLPEVANDSIFAIISEEFGLIGALIVLGLFAVLIVRGFRIARAAPDTFSRLLATGISVWLFVQSLVNVAAMLSLIPLTGVPLPFVSYGGSSMLFSLIGAGILLNISKYTQYEVLDETNRQRRRNGWAHYPGSGRARSPQFTRQ